MRWEGGGGERGDAGHIQPRSQGSLLPVGRVGENPGNEVGAHREGKEISPVMDKW